jgi:hypothetical protein
LTAASTATTAGEETVTTVTTRSMPIGYFPHRHRRNASLLRAGEADLFRPQQSNHGKQGPLTPLLRVRGNGIAARQRFSLHRDQRLGLEPPAPRA